MPTSAEYRDAAQRYRSIAENLLREAPAVSGWVSSFVNDGLVRDDIDASNDRTRTHLVAAGENMQRLAQICDRRAELCAQYANAVRHYHGLTMVERLSHRRPTRPASWVEG